MVGEKMLRKEGGPGGEKAPVLFFRARRRRKF